jgi:hypothetical protein
MLDTFVIQDEVRTRMKNGPSGPYLSEYASILNRQGYSKATIRQYLHDNIVLEDIHSFTPQLIHTFRFGVARQIFEFAVASSGQDLPGQLGAPDIVPPDTFPGVSNGLPGFNTGTVGKRGARRLADQYRHDDCFRPAVDHMRGE